MTAPRYNERRKKARKTPRHLGGVTSCVGAVAVTALMFVVAFFLPVREKEGEDADRENRSNLLPITALSHPHAHSHGGEALENIYAWVDLKSSKRLDSPDSPLLFSAYAGKLAPYHYTQLKQHEVQDVPVFSDKMAGQNQQDSLEQRRTSSPIPWEAQIVMPSPSALPFTPPQGIFWLNEDGLVVANPPAIDEKLVLEALDGQTGLLPTRLEYTTTPPLQLPRIVVRQSSGLPKLDTLAVNALRNHLNSYAQKWQFSGRTTPAPNGLLTVLWHLNPTTN